MADQIDIANDQAQHMLDAALAANKKAHRPEPQGFCLAPRCGEEFNPQDAQRLFCNAACAQEYAKHKPAK